MILSKSLDTTGIQCSKALWLKKYKSEVLAPVDESAETRFKTGHTVGELACDLLPNGLKVDFNPNLEQMVKEIKKLLESYGYVCGSHFVFRKEFCEHIVIPYHKPIKAIYVKHVLEILGELQ